MEKKFKVLPPQMPNFVRFEQPPRPRHEGISTDSEGYPIENFTKEEAEEYAELMKQTFMAHWLKKTLTKK